MQITTTDRENFFLVFQDVVPGVVRLRFKKSGSDVTMVVKDVRLVPDDKPYMILPYATDGTLVPTTDELAEIYDYALELTFTSAPGETGLDRLDVLTVEQTENVQSVEVFSLPDYNEIQVNKFYNYVLIFRYQLE